MTHATATPEDAPCRWESGELGDSIAHARPVSAAHAADVDKALGLRLVEVRLPIALLDDLELIASEHGLARPALIRRVLAQFTAAEFRARAHEEFAGFNNGMHPVAQAVKDETQSACL